MATKAMTVMLVDDERDMVMVTAKTLERTGYKVHAFTNPEKALEHIEIEHCKDCSIVVSDIKMPVISGIELAKRVKKLQPEIKVILMSAFEINTDEWQKLMPSTKIDAFVQKPLRMQDLVSVIRKCVEGEPIRTKNPY